MRRIQSTGQMQSQHRPPAPKDFDEDMTWSLRRFLVKAITTIYALSLISGLTGFLVTRDPHYLLFITPTALIPLVRYLVPMDKKRYDLKLAEINAKKELAEAKLRVQMLEKELAEVKLRVQMLEAELDRHQHKVSRPPAVKT